MKKFISLAVALMMIAMQLPMTSLAEESDIADYFINKDEINCVAIGGSITERGGTTLSYGSLFSDWLEEQTGKTVNFYNAGVGGTGSDFGITRVYDSVVTHNPDIVFVEFSVNDRSLYTEEVSDAPGEADTQINFDVEQGKYILPTDEEGNEFLIYNEKKYTYVPDNARKEVIKCYMETITRQLLALPEKPIIIYNYVGMGKTHIANTDTDNNRIGRLVMPRACIDVHEEVAQKYGIPSIDIDSYIQNIISNGAQALDGNTYTQDEIYASNDCIHPNTTIGTKLYAEFMEKTISDNPQKYLSIPSADVSTIEKYSNNIYDDSFHTIPFTEGTISGDGWGLSSYNSNEQLKTSTTGNSVSFDFSGRIVVLRGTRIGNKFNVRITNANSDGSDYVLENITGVKDSTTRYDILWQKTDLAEGDHTITITRSDFVSADGTSDGTLAIYGIAVNGEIPENGFKTTSEFINANPQLKKTIGGFESNFDGDLKDSFVDPGWEVYNEIKTAGTDDVTVDVKDGRLVMYGGQHTGIHHDIDDNSYDIIYLSFELENTPGVGIRICDGKGLTENDRFSMLKSNPARVWIRDAGNVAARFWNEDNVYWPETGVMHKYELIMNFKNNDQKLYIDGVEAAYLNGEISSQGGTTIRGSSLGDLYIVLSNTATQSSPVYLDNFVVKGYSDYVSSKISSLTVYDNNISDEIEDLKQKCEYLEFNESPVSQEAIEKLARIEEELSELNERPSALTASNNNSYLIGAYELYTYSCNDVAELKINGVKIEENSGYELKDGKILFDGSLFDKAGKYIVEITDSENTMYCDNIEIIEPVQHFYTMSDPYIEKEGVPYGVNEQIKGWSGNPANIFQVYNDDKAASVKWKGREEFKGTYKVEWFDINATINGTQYMMEKMNFDVLSANGLSSLTINTTKDDTWHNIGIFEFNGTEYEYIKVSNGSPVAMGSRFYTEVIRLTQVVDDSALLSEFYTMPQTLTITESENNTAYTNTARIIKTNEILKPDFISKVYVNDIAVSYEIKDDMIMIPETVFTEAKDFNVKVVLINSVESNVLSFTLSEPEHIAYKLSAAEKSETVNNAQVAGTGHSRYEEAPTKVTLDDIKALGEVDSYDDLIWVKWNIGNIEEGDYLVDTWLNSGRLALECKVEIAYNGGEDTIVYNSVGACGNYSDDFITEFYMGNGDKIHFTGNGNEYIKIMLDDDYKNNLIMGLYFIIDSFRLTPWYDMNGVYDEFYGKNVITNGEPYKTGDLISIDISGNYLINKYGYDGYFAIYDETGKLEKVIPRKNIMLYNGTDKKHTMKINITADNLNLEGKTYKFFLWGSDAQPNNSNQMVPYIMTAEQL